MARLKVGKPQLKVRTVNVEKFSDELWVGAKD